MKIQISDQFQGIEHCLEQLQRNQNKKQFIETSFKSLIWFWVTFPLPTILVNPNNVIRTVLRYNIAGYLRICFLPWTYSTPFRESDLTEYRSLWCGWEPQYSSEVATRRWPDFEIFCWENDDSLCIVVALSAGKGWDWEIELSAVFTDQIAVGFFSIAIHSTEVVKMHFNESRMYAFHVKSGFAIIGNRHVSYLINRAKYMSELARLTHQ